MCTFPDLLVGKNVLVTGASRGIGRDVALNYCRMGANVFITARDEEKLKQVRTCHGHNYVDMGHLF